MNRKAPPPHPATRHAQRGLGAVMAIVILVILALLAGALVRFGTAQQWASAQDTLSARAAAAIRAGSEWGQYRALQGGSCEPSTQLDLHAATGFWVRVDCERASYSEGEAAPGVSGTVNVFAITATACNSATACPDDTMSTSPAYVEHQRVTVVTDE